MSIPLFTGFYTSQVVQEYDLITWKYLMTGRSWSAGRTTQCFDAFLQIETSNKLVQTMCQSQALEK